MNGLLDIFEKKGAAMYPDFCINYFNTFQRKKHDEYYLANIYFCIFVNRLSNLQLNIYL